MNAVIFVIVNSGNFEFIFLSPDHDQQVLKMHESLAEIEDERGYKFYVNNATKDKYKENPQLILILKKIKANIHIKYQTYRTAIKLIQLKHSLYSK